jgi:YD repeat-containing protein
LKPHSRPIQIQSATWSASIRHCLSLAVILAFCGSAIAPLSAGTVVYTHDAAGRLTGAGYDPGRFVGYTYDNAGNLTLRQLVVIGIGDSDGDGMDDAWEFEHFQSLARDGTEDSDKDGMSDLGEYLAGTIPSNPESALRILPNLAEDHDGVVVQWQSAPGKTYRLQFKNALDDEDWTDVPGEVPATGEIVSKIDGTATLESSRFYRIRLNLGAGNPTQTGNP